MIDRQCGNCKYFGAETGEDLDIRGEIMQFLHFCENDKSIFKTCLETATGCNKFEPRESEESEEK